MNYLLFVIALTLAGCLLQPESKPGHVYHIDCTDLDADSVTYQDSGMATTFYSTCPVDGDPKPPAVP